ncbi:MAG TPA: PaaI family thioesterase [Hellea balneolensis]|uniref:PaaI family thioesterase n=1 Tax=Hellea balneolensis TaxID=287478 RepID=A0A7V5U1J8_9PROT|nr:PaaI family thioesterase [Hellea balneolensis]
MNSLGAWLTRPGIENLRQLISGELVMPDPMLDCLGYALTDVDENFCVFEGRPGPEHLNITGNVHGGWAMSILDSAAVLCVVTALPKGKLCATNSLEVKFLRPLKSGQACIARGDLITIGQTLAHSRATLKDKTSGKLLAFCSCSVSVFDPREGGEHEYGLTAP